MQCNKNTMNTRVIKGNQFTQDMMIDPRQFVTHKVQEIKYVMRYVNQ